MHIYLYYSIIFYICVNIKYNFNKRKMSLKMISSKSKVHGAAKGEVTIII